MVVGVKRTFELLPKAEFEAVFIAFSFILELPKRNRRGGLLPGFGRDKPMARVGHVFFTASSDPNSCGRLSPSRTENPHLR